MDIYDVNTIRVVVYDKPVSVVSVDRDDLKVMVFPGEFNDGELRVGNLVNELDVDYNGCFVGGDRVGDFACVFPIPKFIDGDKFNCDIVIHCYRLKRLGDEFASEILRASSGVPILIDRTDGECSIIEELESKYGFIKMDI